MGIGHEQLIDKILVLDARSCFAAPAAALRLVIGNRLGLRVAAVGQRHHHVLRRDQVFNAEIFVIGDDLGAPLVGKRVANVFELFADHVEQALRPRENVGEVANLHQEILELGEDFFLLEAGQPIQAHVQDGLRLGLGEPIAAFDDAQLGGFAFGPRADGAGALQHFRDRAGSPRPRHQRNFRFRRRGRGLDRRNDLIDIGQRDREPLQDMAAFARLAQFIDGAARDDFPAMPQECVQHFLERQQPRLPVDQRNHVDAEHGLHRRLRKQIVEQDLGYFTALQFDDDAHAVLVGFVAQAVRGDAVDELVADQIGDALDQLRLVHLVRQFGDDDGLPVALAHILEMSARAHVQSPAAGLVRGNDFLGAIDEARRREVRAGHDLHQLRERDLGILDERDAGGHDFRQIVRRYIGRHADGDAGRPIDEKIGNAGRQHRRLALRLVVIRDEIDRLFVDIREQFPGELRHAHFGVAHGRRRVAIDGSEVTLAVDQQITHRKRLRHAHDGVVHRRIAVRMVFTDHIADDTRRFLIGTVPVVAQFAHRIQDPPVHRLQAVADIGQGASHDYAHGVIQVRLPHLVFEIYGQYFASDLGHLRESGLAFEAQFKRV